MTFIDYKNLLITDQTILGSAGNALQDNFIYIADTLASLQGSIGGLGTISTQDADAVNIDGGTIDGTAIGGTTRAAIKATTLETTGKVAVRAAISPYYALHVPWVTGDLYATALFGANVSANNQPAIQGFSGSGEGVYGSSKTNIGVSGYSIDSAAIQGEGVRRYSGVFYRNSPLSLTPVAQVWQDYSSDTYTALEVRQDGTGYILELKAETTNVLTVSNTGELSIPSDTVGVKLGAGGDASIYYDGSNLQINPKVVGSGGTQFTGAVGLGGAPVTGYPATLYQPADNTGLKVFGYDDMSGQYAQLAMGAYGNARLLTSGYLEIQPAATKPTYLNSAAAGGVFLFYGTTSNQILSIYGYDAAAAAPKAGYLFVQTDGSLYVNAPASEKLALGSYGGTLATIASTGELSIPSDTVGLKVGAGGDATIKYDGTNLLINPKAVGTGICDVQGTLQTDGYNSSDGTAGATADVDVAKVGGGTRTLHFKNGLYTGYTDS